MLRVWDNKSLGSGRARSSWKSHSGPEQAILSSLSDFIFPLRLFIFTFMFMDRLLVKLIADCFIFGHAFAKRTLKSTLSFTIWPVLLCKTLVCPIMPWIRRYVKDSDRFCTSAQILLSLLVLSKFQKLVRSLKVSKNLRKTAWSSSERQLWLTKRTGIKCFGGAAAGLIAPVKCAEKVLITVFNSLVWLKTVALR